MLYVFGFQRVGVVIADLYFIDPEPLPGQESAERGVRLEVRLLEQETVEGTIYAARPITIGRPIWRADLLESVDGPIASFDRTHHHPAFDGWEPGDRVFDPSMSAAPVEFVGEVLSELDQLVVGSGLLPSDVGPDDAEQLKEAVPEILEVLEKMLDRVRAGELAKPGPGTSTASARLGWL